MDKMKSYRDRKNYIEAVLGSMLGVKRDFDFIKYAKAYGTEGEYMRLGDLRGCTVTFDITGASAEDVMTIVCDYVVNGPLGDTAIKHIVVDNEKLIYISPLFKEVA